jgi:DNA-binding transcriptional LysR family regulator
MTRTVSRTKVSSMNTGNDPVAQIPHLGTFAKAAEFGNFTKAALALGLTQAAVSQRIQSVEQNLGMSLFRREGGGVALTKAGHRLYAYAQRILALHHEARAAVTGAKPDVVGELSLAASSVPGEHLLPGFLAVFGRKYPRIRVRATVTDSCEVVNQVERGQAQLGLVGMKENKSHLEFRLFACDQMVLVVGARHEWAANQRIRLEQLGQHPLILREAGSGSRWYLEQTLAQAGMSARDLRVVLELGSNEAIKNAVLRGVGAAILSTHAVKKELQTGTLHAIRVSGLCLKRDMFAVWDRRRVLPIPSRLFLDYVAPIRPAPKKSDHKSPL